MIDNIPEDMKGELATPAAHHIFDIAEDATKISQADADRFHHFLTLLLCLSKNARPDIQLAVSFLCNRVIGPDTDEYKNFARLVNYIQRTISLPLIFSINKSGNIKWYADTNFAVHKYMRIHTGGFMTMVT